MDYASPTVRGLKPARPTAPKAIVDRNNHEGPVTCLSWSCDGHHLATGGEDKTVKIWQFKHGAASPFSLVKTDDSTILQSAEAGDNLGEVSQSQSSTTASSPITALAFSPRHPDILAVASHVDNWNPNAHGVVGGLGGVEVVHGSGSRIGRDGSSGEEPRKVPVQRPRVTIWNIKTRRPVSTILLSHNPVSMTFHPSAYQLLIVCMDKTAVDYGVICWQGEMSVNAESINEAYGSPLDRETRPTDAADSTSDFLKDDTAVDAAEKRKRKEDVESRLAHQRRAESEGDEGWSIRRDMKLVLKERTEEMRGRGFDSGVSELNGACFSPCGTRLYTGNHDGTVHIWHYPTIPAAESSLREPTSTTSIEDAPSAEVLPTLAGVPDAYNEDSTGLLDETLNMAVDADPEAAPPGENGPTTSEDEQQPLLPSSTLLDHSAKAIPLVWLRCIETNQGCVNCIEMDPRRRFFVTGGSEGLVTACNLADSVPFMTFSTYTEEIKSARLSWHGEYLAIAGADRVILVVATGDGSVVHRVETEGRVQHMQWSPARLVLAWVATNTTSASASGKWYSIQM